MPGNLLDRTSCGGKERMEDDGTIVIVDVPNLWYGSMYRTYIQKYQKDPGSISGRSVHDRDLCGGIGTGMLLKHYDMCPWDYSGNPLNYKGVIRLDYAPLWFCTGLLFEKILSHED